MKRVRIKLREILKEKDMTQAQLCEITGIQPSVMSDFAKGRRDSIHIKNWELIAAALNVDPRDIIDVYDDGQPEPWNENKE